MNKLTIERYWRVTSDGTYRFPFERDLEKSAIESVLYAAIADTLRVASAGDEIVVSITVQTPEKASEQVSKDWGYHCKQDGAYSETWFNHGESILRSCAKNWPLIAQLEANDESGYIEVHIMAHSSSDVWAFLREHHAHGIELASEYGDVEPIEEKASE